MQYLFVSGQICNFTVVIVNLAAANDVRPYSLSRGGRLVGTTEGRRDPIDPFVIKLVSIVR